MRLLARVFRRRRHRVLGALILTLTVTVGVVNTVVLLGGRAQSRGRTQAPTEPAECALVLGAGVGEDGTPSWVLQDRLLEALTLYRAGRVKTILVSGDHHRDDYDEPNAMRVWLEAKGVPPSAIFMDHAGVDTYSSVWRAKHVFGASRVIVVTQRFHLPRALWMARSLGMEAEGAPADRRRYRGAIWFEAREVISRTKAFIDVTAGRRPRHIGPPISLEQDGRVTTG